ncbi:metallophosphoesterase family protein [Krasilnikoviella flava]|uniref:Calcineurin-like phosphoesterase superfamily domain-containing protein n=1 Tax=Krasilnikoviella flava TaxID=526729 RepID=A0A1T5KWY8_9MICO|nr:metallophosphoesterase family protein [Krasilnikoviella flava]SKC67975.1 Calcineurin-like phosphoesterase superfamily domain-containing protein [Krasilnikoviella flava]
MSDEHDEPTPADGDEKTSHGERPVRRRRTPPRWVRWTLAGVTAAVACLVFGVSTATAQLGFGPHEAVYSVTNDSQVVVDLGPLGTLEIDSPLPLGLGVDVEVKEIPADLTTVGAANTLAALGEDLESYLQFFSSPDVAVRSVALALIENALWRSLGAAAVLVGAGFALRWLLGPLRRRELADSLGPRTGEIAAGVVVVGLVVTTLSSAGAGSAGQGQPASPVFAGTALEGARITGRLAGVIDTYGGQLVKLYEDNENFYTGADDALSAAWDARLASEAVTSAADAGTLFASPAPAEPTAPVAPPRAVPGGSAEEGLVTLVVISDLHCNTGMTPLIRTTVERSGADVVLNAGDTTMNGTSVEKVCVDSFASAVPRGVPMVVADGNHDSQITSDQEAAHGQTILDGQVVEVDGMRILGDRDALETRVGEGTNVARERTPEQQAADLATTACDDDGVDLLLIHTPAVGLDALETGCVPFQVSGHTHSRSGPGQVGQGIRYVNGSTAGAAPSQPTVGPLHGTAEMTVLRFDPATRTMVDVQVVSVTPDGAATVGEREPVPDVVPPADDALGS